MSANIASNAFNPPIFPEDAQFDSTSFAAFRDRVLIVARTCGICGYLEGTIVSPATRKTDTTSTTTQQKANTTNYPKMESTEDTTKLATTVLEGEPTKCRP